MSVRETIAKHQEHKWTVRMNQSYLLNLLLNQISDSFMNLASFGVVFKEVL